MRALIATILLLALTTRCEFSWESDIPKIKYIPTDKTVEVKTLNTQTFRYDGKDWKILSKGRQTVQIFNVLGQVRKIPSTTKVRIIN